MPAGPAEHATAGVLLDLVRSGRARTRADLVRLTGLSRTAVTARLGALVDAGLVVDAGEQASTGGRPASGLAFGAASGVVLAVAVGRSRTQVAVCDLEGRELASASDDHDLGAHPDDLMPQVADRLAGLLAEAGRSGADVRGTGLSLPGAVDPARGASFASPVIAGWDGVPLAAYLRDVSGAPLFVGNDADVLARAERAARLLDDGGAGDPGAADLLVVKASTGLGLGIVSGGRVVAGHLGGAGELGHTRVAAADGLRCRCGDTGCLEAVAGGWALVQRLAERGRPVGHVRELVALARGGDAEARGLLRDSGRHLGEVLAVAVNLLNPAVVVVGGDMGAAFDLYAAGLRESVYARATALATRDLRIEPARHGDRSGVVGCAALALDHVLAPAAVDAALAARRSTRAGRTA